MEGREKRELVCEEMFSIPQEKVKRSLQKTEKNSNAAQTYVLHIWTLLTLIPTRPAGLSIALQHACADTPECI